jgi:hypothetical protein
MKPINTAALVLLLSGAMGNAAAAEGRALTVYTGFRDGGSFEDVTTGKSISIHSSQTYAASLDLPLDEVSQLQVFYSFQDSSLVLNAAVPGSMTFISELPLQVMYLHFGGTSYFHGEMGHGAYLVGGIGGTLFDPISHGYDSELRLSANVGLGYQQPLGKHMALRFEARGYFTMINSSGGMFCSGGCTIAIAGNGIAQGEVLVGLSFGL